MIQKTKKRSTLHLGVNADINAKLDAIVEYMMTKPDLACLQADLGREKAARYAIVKFHESLPRPNG